VFPVRYELGFYIPEDSIRRSHCREYLKSERGNLVPWINVPFPLQSPSVNWATEAEYVARRGLFVSQYTETAVGS
jgi:hypothetical protein